METNPATLDAVTWLINQPNYAALDEYIRWDTERAAREVNWTVSKLCLLDHLDHVYIRNGYGPSVFEKVLELLYHAEGDNVRFSWRLLNRSLGNTVTKVWVSRLRVPVDGIYETKGKSTGRVTTSKLDRFLQGLQHSLQIHKTFASQGFPLPAYTLDVSKIKEITFYQDPAPFAAHLDERRLTIFKNHIGKTVADWATGAGNVNEEDINGPPAAPTANVSDSYQTMWETAQLGDRKSVWRADPAKIADKWLDIAKILSRLPNLEAFRWETNAPVAQSIFAIIAQSCPLIRTISLRCVSTPVQDAELCRGCNADDVCHCFDETPALQAGSVEGSNVVFDRNLNETCCVSASIISFSRKRLEAALSWMTRWVGAFETLRIERPRLPGTFIDAFPKIVEDFPASSKLSPTVKVNRLELHGLRFAPEYLMAILDASELQSLDINRCGNLMRFYLTIEQHVQKLTKFTYTAAQWVAPVTLGRQMAITEDAIAEMQRCWQTHIHDSATMIKFLLGIPDRLQDLTIRGIFDVYKIRNAFNPALRGTILPGYVPHNAIDNDELLNALVRHKHTLKRFDTLDSDIELNQSQLKELGQEFHNLTYLSISSKALSFNVGLGVSPYDEGEEDNAPTVEVDVGQPPRQPTASIYRTLSKHIEQLNSGFLEVLRSFDKSHRPFAIVIRLDNDEIFAESGAFQAISNGVSAPTEVFYRYLAAANLAVAEDIPIRLLSFHSDVPLHANSPARYIYGLPAAISRDDRLNIHGNRLAKLSSSDISRSPPWFDLRPATRPETEKYMARLGIPLPRLKPYKPRWPALRPIEPRPQSDMYQAGAALGPPEAVRAPHKDRYPNPLGYLAPTDQPLPQPPASSHPASEFEVLEAADYGLADGAFATEQGIRALRRFVKRVGPRRRDKDVSRVPRYWSMHDYVVDADGRKFMVGFDGTCLRKRTRFPHPSDKF